jgi:hypothetical protein
VTITCYLSIYFSVSLKQLFAYLFIPNSEKGLMKLNYSSHLSLVTSLHLGFLKEKDTTGYSKLYDFLMSRSKKLSMDLDLLQLHPCHLLEKEQH